MTWVLVTALAWVLLAVPVAVVIGRSIRLADPQAATAPWIDQVERYLQERAPAAP
jgi:uncharacterized membrane protein